MKADIKPGETVAVMGLGLVGLLMTMWAKLRGPGKVIGIDLHESRLELGRKAGCDVLVNAGERSSVEVVKELTGGRGADCTLHCAAGPHVEAFEHSQLMTRERGRIVLIGIHSRPLTVLRGQFLWKDLLGGCTDYDMDHDLFTVGAELIANGSLPVLDIVTHNVHFTEAPEVYDMLNRREHEAGAVLLRWDG